MDNKYKEVSCTQTKYLNLSKDITADLLRIVADKMDDSNVKSFKFKIPSYYISSCIEKRPETQKEIDCRIKKEQEKKIAEFKKIEKKKKDLITEAKKLGLILTEESNIL